MAQETVLIVDDEKDILELVGYHLTRNAYRVIPVMTGEDALSRARSDVPDLIVLDLLLPGIDGLDVCRILKNDPKTSGFPIIMLSAKGDEADVVTGLELGADDYVTKPFSPRVLLARVKAVLRKVNRTVDADDTVIKRGELVIDPGRHQIRYGEHTIDLTYSEFRILHALARRPGWVFTRNQIIDAVRGDAYPVTERSVDVQVVGLRKKLEPYGDFIETVRGVGYRFREA